LYCKNNSRVLKVRGFWNLDTWVEKYFLKHQNDRKYAIVGYFSNNFEFIAVNFVKEKNDTCYEMYPTEKEFVSKAFFFAFPSAIGSSLHKGLGLLLASGFPQVIEASHDFRRYGLALSHTRPLVVKYDKEINYMDLKNSRLQENMITLGNMKSVVYVGLILIISAGVAFVAEVFSKIIVSIMILGRFYNFKRSVYMV